MKNILTAKNIIDVYSMDTTSGVTTKNINTERGIERMKAYRVQERNQNPELHEINKWYKTQKRKSYHKKLDFKINLAIVVGLIVILVYCIPLIRDDAQQYVRKQYEDGSIRISTVSRIYNSYDRLNYIKYTAVFDTSFTETKVEGKGNTYAE